MPEGIRRALGAIALVTALWAAAVYAGGGVSWSIFGARISSSDPLRPFLLAFAIAAIYVVVSGANRLRADVSRLAGIARPSILALLLAAACAGFSLRYNAWTAGGADAFSYVTQADLWLRGDLRIEMPLAASAPWPEAIRTFTPFGYSATSDGRAIVPVTGPGLPLLMAGFKAVGGHAAMFFVVPASGALLVWASFAIGRRVLSDTAGLAASWLVATSPTALVMSKSVMSDVPAAAFWTLAVALILAPSAAAAFAAGVSAGVALLIRPNLLPIGVALGVWMAGSELMVRRRSGYTAAGGGAGARRPMRTIAFAAGAGIGCVAVAAINARLYGSPFASGYGDLNVLFARDYIPTNARQYAVWLAQTQTPLALLGSVALFVPSRRLWPDADSRRGAVLLALVSVASFAAYCAYKPFDAWWYLRFLLPLFPAVCIGTAAVVFALARGRRAWAQALAAVVIAALGVHGVATAHRLGAYPPGEGERRYATIAELVAQITEPSAVIITTAHVGPLRYYAGRATLRFEVLDAEWLDRAVEWLVREGRHPYILLESWEVPEFERRFAAHNTLGRLAMTPILAYEAYRIGGRVLLFDPLHPAARTWLPSPIPDPQPRCPIPVRAWWAVAK